MKKSSRIQQQITFDTLDSYHAVKPFVLCVLGIYGIVFVVNRHITQADPLTNAQTSVAKDGLRLGVSEEIPEWLVNTHAFCAVAALVLALMQKEMMVNLNQEYGKYISTHRLFGKTCLVLVGVMDAAGYAMGKWSSFANFTVLSVLFAAPWLVFVAGIYFTAKPSLIVWHRIFGNLLIKGCIATPISRWCGALLQRCGWQDALGYYEGIGAVTVLAGIWSMVDLYAILRKEKAV